MGIFEDVGLQWSGKEYVVKAENVLALVASIEEVITLQDLTKTQPPLAKIAMGYGKALRFAGAKVADDEVYTSFFGKDASQDVTTGAVFGLLSMMIPPEHLRGKEQPSTGKPKPAPRKPKAQSNRRTSTP